MPTSLTAAPVEQLREQARRLEAALSVGVATPTTKAVHNLRSSTRRVEAQLELLATIKGLPPYKAAAKKVHRRLEKLRRVAGKVRDCDVQDKLHKRITRNRQRREGKLVATLEQQLPKLARDTEELLAAVKPAKDLEVP